jgi:hypothetical protein
MIGGVMTEEEVNRIKPDSVMKRLAKMLAEASAPPCERTRITDALVSGDFDAFINDDD